MLGKICSLLPPVSGGCQHSSTCDFHLCFHGHIAFLSLLCQISLHFFFVRTLGIAFRAFLDNQGQPFLLLSLIISAKSFLFSFFPYKVICRFQELECGYLWCVCMETLFSPSYLCFLMSGNSMIYSILRLNFIRFFSKC